MEINFYNYSRDFRLVLDKKISESDPWVFKIVVIVGQLYLE